MDINITCANRSKQHQGQVETRQLNIVSGLGSSRSFKHGIQVATARLPLSVSSAYEKGLCHGADGSDNMLISEGGRGNKHLHVPEPEPIASKQARFLQRFQRQSPQTIGRQHEESMRKDQTLKRIGSLLDSDSQTPSDHNARTNHCIKNVSTFSSQYMMYPCFDSRSRDLVAFSQSLTTAKLGADQLSCTTYCAASLLSSVLHNTERFHRPCCTQ